MVRRVARERGVDLFKVKGTGPGGVIVLGDLERLSSLVGNEKKIDAIEVESDLDGTVVPLGIIRKAIANHMQESWNCIPHAGTWVWVNFKRFVDQRVALKSFLVREIGEEQARIYVRPDILVIEGTIRALEDKHRIVNSCFGCEHSPFNQWRGGLKVFSRINLGIAYDDPKGLLVPVLHNIAGSSYKIITQRLEELYQKVRAVELKVKDFRGGTVTFNNVGALKGDGGESIIPHGQSAIISLHRIERDPTSPLYGLAILALRFDHRALDGGTAARFLASVKKFVEKTDFKEYIVSQLGFR